MKSNTLWIIKIVAGFVGNGRTFNLLNEPGVDYAQGNVIGKHVSLNELKPVKPFVVMPK